MIPRKSPAEIEKMRRPAASWRRCSRSSSPCRPGVTTASSTVSRSRHPRPARRPRSRATSAAALGRHRAPTPRHLHLHRRRGRPRHPGRPGDPRRLGRVGRRGRDPRRLARRRRACFLVGDVPAELRARRHDALAMLAGIAPRPGSTVGDISAAIEDVAAARLRDRAAVRGPRHRTEMHEDPQVPTTGPAAAARLQPGLCLAIEPMFTLGSGDVHVDDDRWTVTHRRHPRGPLRAHHRGHGTRPPRSRRHRHVTGERRLEAA